MIYYFIAALIAILLIFFLFTVSVDRDLDRKRNEKELPQRKRAVLTINEQGMYNRLAQALPELIVLAQVSFGSLLYAKSQAARNTFSRKIADFVVCDRAFRVLAIIELDDSSHKGKEAQDAGRDAMLTNAGYHVLRYRHIPDIERVQNDLLPKLKAARAAAQAGKEAITAEPFITRRGSPGAD